MALIGRTTLVVAAFSAVLAQFGGGGMGGMQFEIPPEMLQGMMGGGGMGGMGGQGGPKPAEWPKTENSEVHQDYEWLINTEWKGKTAKYLLLRDGVIESPLKECENEGRCLWAANDGRVLMNTPTLKVVKFTIDGLDKVDKKKLENKDEATLRQIKLITERPGKSGKRSELNFERLAKGDENTNIIAENLYEILEIAEDSDQKAVKSKYRRLSVTHHPDKGGDPEKFAEIREAYEVLGDDDYRRYYDLGGMQLVKNIQIAYQELEGQAAQMDQQLTRIPKNHPQYAQFKQQIDQQKGQFDKVRMKPEIEKKLRSEDADVMVPISAQELYNGVSKLNYSHKRLVICKGCRSDPTKPTCEGCGRCPPEKVQIPKYANTPFGRQVVGMKEKEQESRERCREVPVEVTGLRIPKGAKEGSTLKYMSDVGHQTPGKLPGRIVLKVSRGSPTDIYTIAESDLHTVMHISLEEALFGFSLAWKHLGDETVTITRERMTQPDEVVRLKKKGLLGDGGQRGDLYVRLAVDMPKEGPKKGEKSVTLNAPAPATGDAQSRLVREDAIELREGSAWRKWSGRKGAGAAEDDQKGGKDEL